MVTPKMMAVLKPGITREEVLLELGEPDFWWDGERIFAYQWTMCTMDVVWLAAGNGTAGGGDVQFLTFHALMIEFDRGGQLRRWEQFQSPSVALSPQSATVPGDCSILRLKGRWRSKDDG